MAESKTCLHRVFDVGNREFYESAWNMYGSEIATAEFGTKLCGKPVVWGERCEEHKVERRSGKDRRQSS